MTMWDQRFQSHAIHELLKNVRATLLAGCPTDQVEAVEAFSRLGRVVEHLERRLSGLDPALTSPGMLEGPRSSLASMANHVKTFQSSKDAGQLNAANAHADQLLEHMRGLQVLGDALDMEGLTKSIEDWRRLSGEALAQSQKQREELAAKITALAQQVQASQSQLQQLSQAVEAVQTRGDQMLAQFLQQFSDREQKRLTQFSEQADRRQKQFIADSEDFKKRTEELLASIKKAGDDEAKASEQKAQDHLKKLEELKGEAGNLVKLIGNIGVTGNFKSAADDNKSFADRWRRIAFLTMAGMALVSVTILAISVLEGMDLKMFFPRLATIGVLLIPALFAASWSKEHRRQELANRRYQLELASIDAFLETLPEVQRQEIKAKLAEKYFAHPEQIDVDAPSKGDTVSVLQLIDLLKVVTNQKK